MRAAVDLNKCTGCGICEIICPEVFGMRGGGRKDVAVVHCETVPEEVEIFCTDARNCCKAKAIQIRAGAPVMPENNLALFLPADAGVCSECGVGWS